MHSDSSGYDGETSFKFTHKEIMFLIDVLEKIGEQMKTPEAKGRFAVLLKRFKKVQINNNKEVSVNLEGDDVVSCYHCELMKILETIMTYIIKLKIHQNLIIKNF